MMIDLETAAHLEKNDLILAMQGEIETLLAPIEDEEVEDICNYLSPDLDVCPFCHRYPYHDVDIGVGFERVAVVCCESGVGYFQHHDEALVEDVNKRRRAARLLRTYMAQARARRAAEPSP